jgi:hypothetical protein
MIDLAPYAELDRKIQEHTAESHRLREESRREFDPGCLYVVAFDSGVVKVGKAGNAERRLAQHAKAGVIRASWISPRHIDCGKTERQLIAFCNEHGTLHGGREYFRDISFDLVRAYAGRVVLDHRRSIYLDRLIDAVSGDMAATWEAAEAALRAA